MAPHDMTDIKTIKGALLLVITIRARAVTATDIKRECAIGRGRACA